MANPISSDNFPAHRLFEQRKPDVNPGQVRSPGHTTENSTPRPADPPEINRAHRRMSQESGQAGEPAIVSPSQARHRAALLKALLNDSPAAAVRAHGQIDPNAFEAATARPAA